MEMDYLLEAMRIKEDQSIPVEERKARIVKMLPNLQAEVDKWEWQASNTRKDLIEREAVQAIMTRVEAWGNNEAPEVGHNAVSRVHHLHEAMMAGGLVDASKAWMAEAQDALLFKPMKTFVISRDWTKVMGDDGWWDSDIMLPYPHCTFEFVLDGIPVIQVCMQNEAGELTCLPCVQVHGRWMAMEAETAKEAPTMRFAWLLVMACCIAMEAEVVTHEVIRAPHKLNAKREKQGKAPMMDFHVIDLKRRARTERPSTGEPTRHHRLHFRRGHWRHYEDHKTWIKWQLVGDPSLGIVQSRYSA